MTSTSPARRFAAVLSVGLLLAGAACSASGDDDGAAPTTSADTPVTTSGTAGNETTTSDNGGDDDGDDATATTADTGNGNGVDYEALLPTVDSLPLDYELVDDGDDDTTDDAGDEAFDEDMKRACPDAFALLNDEEDDGDDDKVSRSFATDLQQEIEVTVGPPNDADIDADEIIDAINRCSVIETVVNDMPAIIELQADQLDLGDQGLQLEMLMSLEYNGQTVEISFTGFEFRRDGIVVEVSASSGLEDDLTKVPGHPDVAYGLAATIDETIVG